MKAIVLFAAVLFGCHACHGPIVLHDNSDPSMWVDASDPCGVACGYITKAECTTGGQLDNPACAPQCRNDQQQGSGAQFPLECILAAGADAGALRVCGVTCP